MDDTALAKRAHEQLLIHEGDKLKARVRLEEIKKQQQVAFQQKLQAKQQKKEELKSGSKEALQKNVIRSSNSQNSPSTGDVTFISVSVKDIATIWETLTPEEGQSVFQVLNETTDEICKDCNGFQIWGKDGKFMLATQSIEDGINMSIRLQQKLNSKEWPSFIQKSSVLKQIQAKSEAEEKDVTIFNGPRIKIGIISAKTTRAIAEKTGEVSYSGVGPTKVEAIAQLAQGGQILVETKSFETADSSKIDSHVCNALGTFKLDGFSQGCKLLEVLPSGLKARLKHFGQHCAHCGNPIQPKEQFFKALGSTWHVDHFKCFACDVNLEGSFLEHQDMPYCKPCYLKETASKCFACGESTVGVYITALGQYWHPNCFSCKGCGGKAVDGVNIYQHESSLYCEGCLRNLLEQQESQQKQ